MFSSASDLIRIKTRPRSAFFASAQCGGSEALEVERSCSSSTALDHYSASSDDEVTALIGSAHGSPLPLEFRTSPPEGAHRPTRSLSPPPKLFVADAEHMVDSRNSGPGATPATTTTTTATTGGGGGLSVANGNAASPRKRHRHTHRPHNIQRPCLDFEKMQQVSSFLPSFRLYFLIYFSFLIFFLCQ